jgi:hypothetical protein
MILRGGCGIEAIVTVSKKVLKSFLLKSFLIAKIMFSYQESPK